MAAPWRERRRRLAPRQRHATVGQIRFWFHTMHEILFDKYDHAATQRRHFSINLYCIIGEIDVNASLHDVTATRTASAN